MATRLPQSLVAGAIGIAIIVSHPVAGQTIDTAPSGGEGSEAVDDSDMPVPSVVEESEIDPSGELPEIRAIVIDFREVVRASDAAESVRMQIDSHRQSFQAEFVEIEDELRALEQELTELQGSLEPEEFNRRRRAFEQRIAEAQRTAQSRRAALDQALDDGMQEIRTELVAIIHGIAEENRANLVLNRAEVILMSERLDFNDEALSQLNEELPFVSVALTEDR